MFNNKPDVVIDGKGLVTLSGGGNAGANGGAISSIGVSWSIYNDGNTMTLAIYGSLMEHNAVNAYGSAIFFVSNDHTGTLHIEDSVGHNNLGGSWYTLPGISMHSDTLQQIIHSTIQ
jgi:hypothetical protein